MYFVDKRKKLKGKNAELFEAAVLVEGVKMRMVSSLFFFIGTEAELIKMFPIILKVQEQNISFQIIASGQNNLKNSSIFSLIQTSFPIIELSQEQDIQKSAQGLLCWFIQTVRLAKKVLPRQLQGVNLEKSIMIVHGDTVSTVMGAYLGKRLGMQVAHVEAGLRSHNWLNPFPEEIDRMLTSRCATHHFAPGLDAEKNLSRVKGTVVNTVYNTILDSLQYSYTIPYQNKALKEIQRQKYFVFVLHRQENLVNKRLVRAMVETVIEQSKTVTGIIILHKLTEIALTDLDLLGKLKSEHNIILMPRVEYFDFMKLLGSAEYVITDGGSNQEELSYMGKPCMIIRSHTERQDGIGKNALLYNKDLSTVCTFVKTYQNYLCAPIQPEFSPSTIIVEALKELLQKK